MSTLSPNGFHGWRIALALAVTQTVGFGVLFYAFTVFTLPMEAELGVSRAQTSGAYSLALLLSGLAALPIGRWVDAHGARWLMSCGSALGALLVFAWSYVGNLTELYLVQAGIGLVMAAVLYDVAFTVLAKWFRRHRMRALVLVTLVAALASTIFVPLSTLLVEELGWRSALRVLAAILAVVTVPLHALVLRDRPETLGQLPDGESLLTGGSTSERSVSARAAVKTPSFWWLTVGFTCDRLAIVAVTAHSVPMLLERGHPPGVVAAAVGSIGLLQVAGRLLFAPGAAAISLKRAAALTFAIRATALAALLLVPGPIGLWVFAALFGLANGATTLAKAGLIAEHFGPANFGAISGTMTLFIATAQTAAPVAAGALRVQTGDYRIVLLALLVIAVCGTLAVLRVNSPSSP